MPVARVYWECFVLLRAGVARRQAMNVRSKHAVNRFGRCPVGR